MEVTLSLDEDWPPHQPVTLVDLVAEARAIDWDFATWCCPRGQDASDPEAACLNARIPGRAEGEAGLAAGGPFHWPSQLVSA